MAPLNIEYCLARDFHFLFPSREDCDPDKILPAELLDIYNDGSKLKIFEKIFMVILLGSVLAY